MWFSILILCVWQLSVTYLVIFVAVGDMLVYVLCFYQSAVLVMNFAGLGNVGLRFWIGMDGCVP